MGMIRLTEKAVEKIKEISDAEGIDHTSVRVKVTGGGCAGMTQDMAFLDFAKDYDEETDEKIEQDGVTIVVDMMSLQYLEGVEIDYITQGFESGFRFINPNVKGSCGCGSSVSF